jgi:hypothetical protein
VRIYTHIHTYIYEKKYIYFYVLHMISTKQVSQLKSIRRRSRSKHGKSRRSRKRKRSKTKDWKTGVEGRRLPALPATNGDAVGVANVCNHGGQRPTR